MNLHLALARNVGTCRPDAKGKVQVGGPCKDESTEAGQGTEQLVVAMKFARSEWSEGVASSSLGHRSTV